MNVKLTIEYDGTEYHGFQIQPNAKTIQEELESALAKLLKHSVRVVGAGRTDAGVHAAGQVVHFSGMGSLPVERLVVALNSVLPRDIRAVSAESVPETFHARYSARRKTYVYTIYRGPYHSVFWRRYSWWVRHGLDVFSMQQAAHWLVGRRDFASFAASGGAAKTSERNLMECSITEQGPLICAKFTADGFLYNMVRNLMGTLVDIGTGTLTQDGLAAILAGRDRSLAGITAPPQGLCLHRVDYELS